MFTLYPMNKAELLKYLFGVLERWEGAWRGLLLEIPLDPSFPNPTGQVISAPGWELL